LALPALRARTLRVALGVVKELGGVLAGAAFLAWRRLLRLRGGACLWRAAQPPALRASQL
jgi:hypothetical protein